MTESTAEPRRKRSVRLVLFDCDGVLVDSEALVIDEEAQRLTAAGFPIRASEIAARFTGISYRTMMKELGQDFGRPIPDELSEAIQAGALERFEGELMPVSGIEGVIEATRSRCVASSSDTNRIELSLRVCGLLHLFDPCRIFSAQQVERGKPFPDLFLFAAKHCGVRPSDCLVIEDSPPGVEAARRAGMEVLGLGAGSHAQPDLGSRLLEAGASGYFPTAEALAAELRSAYFF